MCKEKDEKGVRKGKKRKKRRKESEKFKKGV
jgi:hypothetical protein